MWKIFFFPHYHYDIAWKFIRQDYSYINEKILKQVVELCENYPDFKFGIESVYQLIEIEKKNPKLFKRIKQEIKNGKIEIIDGQYLMADTFIPGGEVLVREILFGKKYVKEKFQKDIKMGWIVDSFGLNSQIPQIYKDSGYEFLVFRRGYKLKPNQSEFWWQGLDDTKILTHCLSSSHAYRAGLFSDSLRENIEEMKEFASTKNILMPCGVGSTLFPDWIFETIENYNKNHPEENIKIDFPENFFKEIEKQEKKLKIQKGEMYSGNRVFEGIWSTRIWLKLEYTKIDNLILNVEKFATIAHLLGKKYPKKRLEKCWDKMLFLGFHDILPGCSIDEVYDEVKEIFAFLNKELSEILNNSLSYICSCVNLDNNWGIVVFNPTNFEIQNYVTKEIEIEIKEKIKGIKMEVPDEDWEILEEERDSRGYLKRVKIEFLVKIPSLGYRVYKIIPIQFFSKKTKKFNETDFIENNFLKVKLDKVTGNCQILDKQENKILDGGQLEIENDVGSVYSHEDIAMSLVGPISKEGERMANRPIFKIEDSFNEKRKISQRIEIKENVFGCFWPYRLFEYFDIEFYRQKLLEIKKEVKLFKNIPWAEFTLKLKNNFPEIRLRVKFNLNFKGEYSSATPFGVIKRNKEKRDFPMDKWLIYDGKNQGVAVGTQGIFGHQVVENSIYLTLLRSVNLISYGDKGPITPANDALELGKSFEYKYAVFPYTGNWKSSEIWKQVQTYTNPPIAIEVKPCFQKSKKKKIPSEFSFLKLPANLILSALKLAEDEKSIILRCYETAGKKENFELDFFKKPKEILVSNITEEKENDFLLKKIKPFKIITLKLKF